MFGRFSYYKFRILLTLISCCFLSSDVCALKCSCKHEITDASNFDERQFVSAFIGPSFVKICGGQDFCELTDSRSRVWQVAKSEDPETKELADNLLKPVCSKLAYGNFTGLGCGVVITSLTINSGAAIDKGFDVFVTYCNDADKCNSRLSGAVSAASLSTNIPGTVSSIYFLFMWLFCYAYCLSTPLL